MGLDTEEQDQLPADDAREKLFDEILEQLARCDLFSNTALSNPAIFPVYAHENSAAGVGTAHASCVHDLIGWFQRIKAGILSDKSALPPLTSELEDTSALRNIIANQIRLLPLHGDGRADEAIPCIDKVLAVQSQIEVFVHGETEKDGFHHVLTEIAILRVRKSRRPDRHGMVPVALDGAHHLRYLSVFGDSDITFKLKSISAADKHALFFQLLEQIFVQHNAFANDLKNCYKKVADDLNLSANGKEIISRGQFHECLNSNMTRMYHKHWSTFSTAMRNGKFNEYAGILGKHVLDILDQNKAKERREILQWVSPIASPPMPGKYGDGRAKRLEGTCDWVIEDERFVKWYESDGSAIISLQGTMGMGKTNATARVIEWIQQSLGGTQQHRALAHFYCIEQDEMRNNAVAIVRSIVRQVATGPAEGAPLNEAVVSMWEKHVKSGHGSDTTTLDDWEHCLSKLIALFHGVTLVLDALDECKPRQRGDLTKLFNSLAGSHSNLKIFVSSRPEPDLSRWLKAQSCISMQNGNTSKDIAAFVQDKIAEHSEWPDLDPELKERMVKTIVDKSQGLFLCAHLQIESLQECIFEEDILDGLENLPQELTPLYEKLYHGATVKPAAKKYTDRALRWVLSSLRPLTSDELLYAISQDAHSDRLSPTCRDVSERLILKSCHSFLALDSSNTGYEGGPPAPVWRLAHQAVAEFFEKSASCSEERAEMHFEAGKVCLMITLNTFGGPAVEDPIMNDYTCPCDERVSAERPWHRELQQTLGEYAVHENQESRYKGSLSQTLLCLLKGSEKGYSIYGRWLRHADSLGTWCPLWSAVYQRSMPSSQTPMSPISLACYLGFPQTLNELLNSADLEKVTYYDSKYWCPWRLYEYDPIFRQDGLRWSAVALACARDELKVVQRLLDSQHLTHLRTNVAEEVPPIVAAARGDSVKVIDELLRPQYGLSLSSRFTSRHGHVVRFAIMGDSLQVLPLLLDRVFVDATTLKEALSSVKYTDFRSTKTIPLLLQKGVEVNTPLQVGTLLAAAAFLGDESLVVELLDKGANVNMQFQHPRRYGHSETALEVCLEAYLTDAPSVARLLIENGATVSARAVGLTANRLGPRWGSGLTDLARRGLMRLLVTQMPDPNGIIIFTAENHECALYQALIYGNVECVELLLDRGADPNLSLKRKGAMRQACSAVFWGTLSSMLHYKYPYRQMVELLEKAGAEFGSLEGPDLDIALAATAWAGLTTHAAFFLQRGADPNARVPTGQFKNALSAAAASPQPEAPNIVRMLLDKADVNLRFPDQRIVEVRAELALDFPLWLIMDKRASMRISGHVQVSHVECLRNWVRSAAVLASNGAVWDVDFSRWRECLSVEPELELEEAKTLDTIQGDLERNWNQLSAEQKASDEWRIKDPLEIAPRWLKAQLKGI